MSAWSPLSALLLAIFAIQCSSGAKILAVTTLASPSHGIWNRALIEALADKGHDVTSLIPYVGKNRTGLRYYDVGGKYDATNLVDMAFIGLKQYIETIWELTAMVDSAQIEAPAVKDVLLDPKADYDLIIFESCSNGAFAGAFGKIKAPIVAICAFGDASWNWDSMWVDNFPSAFPQATFSFKSKMSFLERVQNFLYLHYERYVRGLYLDHQQALANQVFGKDAADLRQVEENYSLLLINSGPLGFEPGRSLPPNVKEVGCLHCRKADAKNLQKDLQEFLDTAYDGFVYLSFGSNVKSNLLPKEMLDRLVQVLGELKLRVLWKFEAEELEGRPQNVKINKWLPQQEVLAHKNIRLFITHGGRLSIQEAIYHGAPLLVVPFFSDQYLNGERVDEMGVGLRLNYRDLNPASFKKSIRDILDHPKYLQKVKEMSAISRDQPETPLERAVFWTEHVIRHKGAKHLRPAGRRLNWFQLYSLDVIDFLLLALISPLVFLYLIYKKVFSSPSKPKKQKSG